MARKRTLDSFHPALWVVAEAVVERGWWQGPAPSRNKAISFKSTFYYFRRTVRETPPGVDPRADKVRATLLQSRCRVLDDGAVRVELLGTGEADDWLSQMIAPTVPDDIETRMKRLVTAAPLDKLVGQLDQLSHAPKKE